MAINKKTSDKKEVKTSTSKIEFSIQSVSTNYFSISIPKIMYDISKATIDYNLDPSIKYSLENDLALIKIKISGFVNETKEKILDTEIAFTYHVKNFKSYMKEVSKDKWDFINPSDRIFITNLLSIAVSTTRGMLIEKTKGTIIEGKMLPIVNPNTFFKQ